MLLKNLAKLIYESSLGTAAEDTNYTIKAFHNDQILFSKKAKEMKDIAEINDPWIVAEVLIDYSDQSNETNINKDKIITVF